MDVNSHLPKSAAAGSAATAGLENTNAPLESRNKFAYTFTAFTPTYNRANTLGRVYQSLLQQTFRDFEWLIVDDGSTDGTAALVRRWQHESWFPIRYLYQPNAGKHVAMNRGAREAHGELFLPIDSDDACTPNALERFDFHWRSIPEAERRRFSAVTALCCDASGEIVGNRFPKDILDSDSIEIRLKHGVQGEKWGFQRTRVLREHPFPEIPGEPFVTEALIWRQIARKYRTRYVNEPLRIYHQDPRSLTMRLSNTSARGQAGGMKLYCQSALNEDLAWFRYAPYEFFKAAVNFLRCSLHKGVGFRLQWMELRRPKAKLLWLLAIPVGVALYWRDLGAE